MKRIASSSAVATAPTYSADAGTPGHFAESPSPTHLTAKWCESVQESLILTVEDGGGTPSDSMTQFSDAVAGVHAVKSGATTTGTVTTPRTRVAIASDTCLASAATSAALASSLSTASGAISAVVAAGASTASGAISAVVGAISSTATAAQSVVVGGSTNDATGTGAVCLGGTLADATADHSATVGGNGNTAGGARSVVAGGSGSIITGADSFMAAVTTGYISAGQKHAIIGAYDATTCNVAGSGRVILASRGVALASSKTTGGNADYVVGGGYSTSTVSGLETANADLNWTIDSQTGNFRSNGTFSGGNDPNADVAEYHEHAAIGAIPVGALVANTGRKIRLAVPGDRVFGVVSATPLLVAGGADLGWSGQYLADEWGRPRWKDVAMVRWGGYDGRIDAAPQPVPEDAEHYTARDRVRNPAYDPARVYVPRTDRPEEWSPVAKLGLVRVRVAESVAVGDMLAPGTDGVAVATDSPSGRRAVEVLEVLSGFGAARGYGIALCEVG